MRNGVWRIDAQGANALQGRVVWAPAKSVWNSFIYIAAIVLGAMYFSWGGVLVFLISTYIALLLGHSLGMHRRLIHKTFQCAKPFERFLVYLGVLVGMSGPFGVIRIHDIRDWAQREAQCHDFFAHRRGLWMDAFWQLHCKFEFTHPPKLVIEPEFADDVWYRWMEKTWPLHQLPIAALLYYFGGMSWVAWGIFVRIAVGVTSHWVVTYFAHNPGPGRWLVPGAAVQASNLPSLGFLTHGECWHNNHHAFPESAKIGLDQGQFDSGWLVLTWLEKLGLVSHLGLPRVESKREDLMHTH